MTDIAATVRNRQELPGMSQVGGESLARWAESHGVELELDARTTPSIGMGIDF